jgi:hypothetical protein
LSKCDRILDEIEGIEGEYLGKQVEIKIPGETLQICGFLVDD